MRAIIQGSIDFGLTSAGLVNTANPVHEDIAWPGWSSLGTSGNLATQNPTIIKDNTSILSRLVADDGGLVFLDISGAAALSGLFVDVCRYGVIG